MEALIGTLTDEEKARKREQYRRWCEQRYAEDPAYREKRNAIQRERYRKDRDHRLALARARREQKKLADPEAWAAYNREQVRKWRERREAQLPEYFRDRQLRQKYGITFAELNGMLAAQQFKCAVCETALDEITRHVDHDHATGQVRGLLCHNCNVTLGLCKDSPDILRKAASYLERNKEPLQKVGKYGN